MCELVIKGFKNRDEVEMFRHWYCGQGEQDASIWFEETAREKDVRDFLSVDNQHPETDEWNGDSLTMVLK
jgi:hypothetical protein